MILTIQPTIHLFIAFHFFVFVDVPYFYFYYFYFILLFWTTCRVLPCFLISTYVLFEIIVPILYVRYENVVQSKKKKLRSIVLCCVPTQECEHTIVTMPWHRFCSMFDFDRCHWHTLTICHVILLTSRTRHGRQ